MDLRIPLFDDLEFVRSLRNSEQFAGLKIVLLTTQPQAVSQRDLQELKIDFLLIKPTSRGEFLNTLRALLPESKQAAAAGDEPDREASPGDAPNWREIAHSQPHPWPEAVREVLEDVARERLPELLNTPDIDLIQALADELLVLDQEYDLPILKTYAGQLQSAVEVFDVSAISRLLDDFPELLGPRQDDTTTHGP
jgi:CheY-like chemotaxis protein